MTHEARRQARRIKHWHLQAERGLMSIAADPVARVLLTMVASRMRQQIEATALAGLAEGQQPAVHTSTPHPPLIQ